MLSSRTSSSSILVVVLWVFLVGVLTLVGTVVFTWQHGRPGSLRAVGQPKKDNKFTAAEQAERDKSIEQLQVLQGLSRIMTRQLELIGMLKEAKEARKAAKKDKRLAELIDGFDRVDAEIREEHARLSASLDYFLEKQVQGIDQHIENAVKTNAKVANLLKMQQEIAKEDRALVEAK